MSSPCKVCDSDTDVAFTAKVLQKYPADYRRCRSCGFMFAENPHWLAEAYSSAISDLDLGAVNRAVTFAPVTERALLMLFDHTRPCVDYGAGYGVFVRLMRDRGYDFHWQDVYAENIFAKGHVWKPETRYELVTAYEVFEHLVDPVNEVETMLGLSDNLLFSTVLVPNDVTPGWWYFGPEHGQHIAFYTPRTLDVLAERFNLSVRTHGDLHLLTRQQVPARRFALIAGSGPRSVAALSGLRRRRHVESLLGADWERANGRRMDSQDH